MTEDEKARFISDPQGFISYVKNPGFTRYTDKIIAPAYEKLKSRGILNAKVTPESYFAYRIFEDESLATAISKSASKGSTFFALVGNGRCKFGYGVQERLNRVLNINYGEAQGERGSADVVSL